MRLLSVAVLLVLAGCSRSGVEVHNIANTPIEKIEIRVAGNELSIDRLNPGDSRRIGYSTKTEETIAVSFRIQGKQGQCSAGFYVSPPFEDEFTVSISSDGKCAISHKPVPS
jgi:hypothetical protein